METNYYANMPETYKPIVGFPLYEVSDFGNVRNIKTCKILKNRPNGNGYLRVDLRNEGKTFKKYVHRLVAETFLDNFADFEHVNHKDEIKTNNHVSNLEWLSARLNTQYSRAMCIEAKRFGQAPYYLIFNSYSEAQYAGFHPDMIKKSIANKEPYKGYLFRLLGTKADLYKEEEK